MRRKKASAEIPLDDDERWAQVIEVAARSIVQIRSLCPKPFEGSVTSGVATGFVVDKLRGLVLTNKHVVQCAPTKFDLVFSNEEVVTARQIYVDPVHDFGFLGFDPAALQFMEIEELILNPMGATKDVQVRVVGSDAGEKLMVLRGTISRIDRNPPEYNTLNDDVNTNYIAASCDTSGGSSGSPVLNIEGEVVALNCGGAVMAASSFFLPLTAIVRALEHLRCDKKPTRGSIHCVLRSTSIAECIRMGITKEEEDLLRKSLAKCTDLLVVKSRVPSSVVDTAGVRNGDILLKVDGEYLNDFTRLEQLLDSKVGQPISLELKRGPSMICIPRLIVQDAFEGIPSEYIEYSGSILLPLSVARAESLKVPVDSGIFVEVSGFSLINGRMFEGEVISKWGSTPIKCIADLVNALSTCRDGDKVSVEGCYPGGGRKFRRFKEILEIDRHWYPIRYSRRDNNDFSKWHMRELIATSELPRPASLSRNVSFRHLADLESTGEDDEAFWTETMRSLVFVQYASPGLIDGFDVVSGGGAGFVIDKIKGLILTSRSVVISMLGDVRIIIASFKVPAKIVFMHPLKSYCIVQVDLTGFDVGEVPLPRHYGDVSEGQDVVAEDTADGGRGGRGLLSMVGMTTQSRIFVQKDFLQVTSRDMRNVETPFTPRFTPKNFESLTFQSPILDRCVGGVLLRRLEQERRSWVVCGFVMAMTVRVVSDEQEPGSQRDINDLVACPVEEFALGIEIVRSNMQTFKHDSSALPSEKSIHSQVAVSPIAPNLHIYSLASEFEMVQLNEATSGFGLPLDVADSIARAFDTSSKAELRGKRVVFSIVNILAQSAPSLAIHTGDILVSVEGESVVELTQIERMAHRKGLQGKRLKMRVLRVKEQIDIEVPLAELSAEGTRRLLTLAGMQMQAAPLAARFHGYSPFRVKDVPQPVASPRPSASPRSPTARPQSTKSFSRKGSFFSSAFVPSYVSGTLTAMSPRGLFSSSTSIPVTKSHIDAQVSLSSSVRRTTQDMSNPAAEVFSPSSLQASDGISSKEHPKGLVIAHERPNDIRSPMEKELSQFAPGTEPEGIYLSCIRSGSPAEKGEVTPVRWVISLKTHKVRTLQDVFELIQAGEFKHNESFIVRTRDWQGLEEVFTLRMDLEFWPTTDMNYDEMTRSWGVTTVDPEPFQDILSTTPR